MILPTETVYGLAGDASDPAVVAAIFEAKGRPRFNPLISHVADLAAAEKIAIFDERARKLAEHFWPGPLTLVLPISPNTPVCDLARAGLDTVAVRVPGHPLAHALLARFGGPFLAGSAFTAVDAFYAPVAFRVRTYGLDVGPVGQAWVDHMLALPAMLAWEKAALAETWREDSHEAEIGAAGRIVADYRAV